MKRGLLLTLGALVLILALALSACNPNASATVFTEDIFSSATKAAAPAFPADTTRSLRATTTWQLGDPIYELYGILVDGDWEGYFNLYRTLESADEYFNQLVTGTSTAITEQQVNSPVDLGFNGDSTKSTYNTYYSYDSPADSTTEDNHIQTFGRQDGSMYYMLTGMHNLYQGENKSLIQGVYNEETGDVEIALYFANYVDASTSTDPNDISGWETVRAYVSGNTATNTFALKVIRDGTGYDHNIVGYGISAGESNYFLMKIANNSFDMSTARYYSFKSDATLAELKAMDAAGLAAPDSNTEAYLAKLPDAYAAADLTAIDPATLDVTIGYTQ